MYKEDVETLVKIGNALWVDSTYSANSTLETVSAVSLMSLTPERALEKATIAMLQKASSRGLLTNASPKFSQLLENSFFRLDPEERFLLVALHLGHWSYARLSRIMNITPDLIQEKAWSARIQLGGEQIYPAGPGHLGPQCPEYDSSKPWTQRFLDDEITSARDRIFLQNHLMACTPCSSALNRCRELYFNVEKEVTAVMNQPNITESMTQVLESRPQKKYLSEMTFLESLVIFIRKRDIIFIILLSIGLFFINRIF